MYLSLSESGVQSNVRSCVWNVIFLMRFLDLAIFSSFRWLCLDIGVLEMDFLLMLFAHGILGDVHGHCVFFVNNIKIMP